jgi:DNA-3-methyladenine glycosylase II
MSEEKEVKKYLISIDPNLKILFHEVNINFSEIIKPIYISLIGAIIGQKISYSKAKQLRGNFYSKYGLNCKPQDINCNDLSAIGLSSLQIDIIQRVNNYLISNKIELNGNNLNDLASISGIGPWTIKTTMLTSLLSWDIFPENDYFIKKRIQKLYGLDKLPSESLCRQIAEKWSPYRSFVTWHIWRWF